MPCVPSQAVALMGLKIDDVAKAAGVSTATVSNVLNKRGKVGRQTRRLVLSTVKRLGYLPNIHARRLASRSTHILGIVVSDIENPFFPEIIKSFLDRAHQLSYDALLSDTNYDPQLTRQAVARMMAHEVSGVAVMTSEISAQLIEELTRRKIAVTFLDLAPASGYVSTLRIDYASGIDQLVKHLYDLGHRNIAFVTGRPKLKSNVARLEAYQRSLLGLGLAPGPILQGNLRFEGGLAAGLAVAKMSPRPTAVMAVNDQTAVGVLKGLLEAGCRVPQDISLTGFDRTRLAEYSAPSMTTVDIHRDLLGRMAADVLHELCTSASPHGKEYEISAELVIGHSTGPAPQS